MSVLFGWELYTKADRLMRVEYVQVYAIPVPSHRAEPGIVCA